MRGRSRIVKRAAPHVTGESVPIEDIESTSPRDPYPVDAPAGVSRTMRRLLRRLKLALGDNEVFLPLVLRATPLGTARQLTDQTQLVIEGYPRSGNTFASRAIEFAATDPIVVSSHVHVPAGVIRAVRLHYPTLVLIRQPLDSICSEKIAAPHASLTNVTHAWIHYHQKIWPYRHGFVVATFDEVVTDFGSVTKRVNDRFGTSFACFVNSDENKQAVFDAIEERHLAVHGDTEHVMPRPSPSRRSAKEQLLERLKGPELQGPLEVAEKLYRDFARLAGTPDL